MIRCSTVGGKGLCKIMIHYNKKHAKDEPKKFNILIDSKKVTIMKMSKFI